MALPEIDPVVFAGGVIDFPDQHLVLGRPVDLILPEAESPAGGLVYSISPELDGGLSFDPSTRKIAGTPDAIKHGILYRYIVTDAAGSTVSFEFRIFVRPTPYNVANEDLVSLLPPNATDFEKAIEAMISQNILPIDDNGHARMPILDAWNPDAIPEHLLPFMGLNLSLIIDASLPIEAQRDLIRNAYNLHSIEGTPQSLLNVIFALGHTGASIVEGTTDGEGNKHWTYYSIQLNENIPIAAGRFLIQLIRNLAPARCKLVSVDVTQANQLWDGSILWDGTYSWGSIVDAGLL